MAGLVPAIHVSPFPTPRRGCPAQGRAWRRWVRFAAYATTTPSCFARN